MRRVFLLLCGVLFLPGFVSARTVGFAGVTLWYSKEPVFANTTVRIYSALINSGDGDLTGTVEFLDNGSVLGKVPVTVLSGGRIKEVWFDWTPTLGDHKVSARLVDAKIQGVGKEPVVVAPSFAVTGVDSRFFDLDTDGDGVGDKEDKDDDADGFSDEREVVAGSDPRNKKDFPRGVVLVPTSNTEDASSLSLASFSSGVASSVEAVKAGDVKGVVSGVQTVARVARTVNSSVDVWREAQHVKVAQALLEVEREQEDPAVKSPLGYFKLAGLWVVEKIVSTQLFLYASLVSVFLLIIRYIRRRRNRLY
jgi:hypothetical protein